MAEGRNLINKPVPNAMNTAQKTLKRDASNFDDYVMASVVTILFLGLFAALLVL